MERITLGRLLNDMDFIQILIVHSSGVHVPFYEYDFGGTCGLSFIHLLCILCKKVVSDFGNFQTLL